MDKITAFLNRKVLGVKMLYLVAVGVLILAAYAVYAWRTDSLDSAVDEADTDDDSEDSESTSGAYPSTTLSASDYDSDTSTDTDVATYTNDEWQAEAIAYLQSANLATALEAQKAVEVYLDGSNGTYKQKQLINKVIAAIGTPPNIPSTASYTSAGDDTAWSDKKPAAPGIRKVNGRKITILAALRGEAYRFWISPTRDFSDPQRKTVNEAVTTMTVHKSNHDYWVKYQVQKNGEWTQDSGVIKTRSGR